MDSLDRKGYAHPLFSMDLLSYASLPEDDARFTLPVAQGVLVVPAALRQRAEGVSPGALEGAVLRALAHHREKQAHFAHFGLTAAWGENMSHWLAEMSARQSACLREEAEIALLTQERRALVRRCEGTWARLVLASRLAGLGTTLLSGRAPRTYAGLFDGLRAILPALAEPDTGGRLAQNGFSAGHMAELRATLVRAVELEQALLASERAHRKEWGALMVIRGALLGDLVRLSQAARHVYFPERAEALQIKRLLRAPRHPVPSPPG